ncbi:MAG: hypothetical protein FWG87_12840 [Defluviitaleaceae bacterium]|nr:hypothetical protein [Defluviitaleaceae bacterium]
MYIQNIKGTSERHPDGYKSWIEFWEDKTNETAGYGKVGGHVKKAYSTDNTWYIAAITAEQNALNVPYEYNGKLAKLR